MELLPPHKIKKLNMLLLALAHPTKRTILLLLSKHKTLMVGELVQILKIDQPVVSQHLAVLRKFNILKSQRNGKYVFYCIDLEKLSQIQAYVDGFETLLLQGA